MGRLRPDKWEYDPTVTGALPHDSLWAAEQATGSCELWCVCQAKGDKYKPSVQKSVDGYLNLAFRGSFYFKNYWDARAWFIKLTREYERKLAQLNLGK